MSSKLEAEKSAKSELEYHKEKLQMVLKEATSKLEADLRSSATHTCTNTHVCHACLTYTQANEHSNIPRIHTRRYIHIPTYQLIDIGMVWQHSHPDLEHTPKHFTTYRRRRTIFLKTSSTRHVTSSSVRTGQRLGAALVACQDITTVLSCHVMYVCACMYVCM